jgi:hypothetical protein
MKFFVIIVIIGILGMTPLQNIFAHEVTEFYGVGGCPVNSCGITDWDRSKNASDTMFYVSLISYGMIMMMFYYSFHRKNSSLFNLENEN